MSMSQGWLWEQSRLAPCGSLSVVTEVEYCYLFSGTSDVGNIIQYVVVRLFTLLWYRA
jgi:hypothetical protein